ncbi:ABC transporter permease [Thermanaeromonas sp. C210]|uniref:ABC transporter permease n=1 Tax=Thermanaeromonas sp. C210 TaxID=2731925 RepID=UPI00156451C7|nr:ABC transporter permease subunit [Thermanaeromonas sp. C210]
MWLMALFTFREAWRKKVVIVVGVLTLGFLVLYGTGLHFIGENLNWQANSLEYMQGILVFVLGVYFAGFLVAGLSIMSAVGSISGEIENGTIPTLATRPLSRSSLLLGKFAGQAAVLVTYAAFFFLALAGLLYWQVGMMIPGLLPALGLFVLEPVVLLAITMWGTTRLPTMGNGILAFSLYALAVVGGMIEQIGALLNSTPTVYAGVITSLLLPVDSLYRRLVAEIGEKVPFSSQMGFVDPQDFLGPFGSPSTPSDWMIIYTLMYIFLSLAAAVYFFNRRDI